MTILVIADHDGEKLLDTTAKLVGAATKIGLKITILVAGHQCRAVGEEACRFVGIEKVIFADAPDLARQISEPMGALIAMLAPAYTHILASTMTRGKSFLPRAAGLLDVMQISDVEEIVDPCCFIRPIYAGNALQTVRSHETPILATIRSTAFDPAILGETANCPLEEWQGDELTTGVKFISEALSDNARPELSSAKIVISGGRGMQSGENFVILERVADRLGAAIGASRAAVDSGFAPNEYQVGQTGKVVAPQLYIAVGISGAIQHLAGMKDSKVIVAINKDEEAPIFQIADYGLVADLFQAVPELERELEKAGY